MTQQLIELPRLGKIFQDYKHFCQQHDIIPMSSLSIYNKCEEALFELRDTDKAETEVAFDSVRFLFMKSEGSIAYSITIKDQASA